MASGPRRVLARRMIGPRTGYALTILPVSGRTRLRSVTIAIGSCENAVRLAACPGLRRHGSDSSTLSRTLSRPHHWNIVSAEAQDAGGEGNGRRSGRVFLGSLMQVTGELP
jgi:hypothetical protein